MSNSCFHCLEPIPAGFDDHIEFEGKNEAVCCIGCKAVAETIISQGMTDYYKFRTDSAGKVECKQDNNEFIQTNENETGTMISLQLCSLPNQKNHVTG